MDSDEAPADVRVDRDIAFSEVGTGTGTLRLDLYRPAAGASVPVVVWLHGGGWFTGDRTLVPDLHARVRATGLAFAAVDYRLSGEAVFPAQLHDVRAAIRFLRARAGAYGLDPAAIGVWGSSAGGHLAALAGLTGHLGAVPGEEGVHVGDASVAAVAESYGPVDLAASIAETERTRTGRDVRDTPEARVLGGHPADRPETARQANPLTWVTQAAPPFQISHGTGDVLVAPSHSEALHEALVAAGTASELFLLGGYRHGFLNPAGRMDVALQAVMDDGRLAAEGRAAATRRSGSGPAAEATFGFADVDRFFRTHLGAAPSEFHTPGGSS